MKQIDKILQEALIKNNVLAKEEMRIYSMDAETSGESIKDYLLNQGVVTRRQLLIALSQSLGIETIDLSKTTIQEGIVDKIPIKIAWYYKFMPLKIENNLLTIACAKPLDVKVEDEIRMHLGYEIHVVLADDLELAEALKRYYGFASDTIDRIMTKEHPQVSKVSSADTGQWIEDLEKTSEDPTVSHLVNEIILEAYKKRATDIHIEPYRNKVRFRYRIDGVLVDANLPQNVKHFLQPILSRIKILANLSITEKRLPQDGSAVVKTNEQQLDLRISTMPTPRGESMVIRILPTKVMLFSLEKLGFDQEGVAQLSQLIEKPHGILFLTGPTGSGKTTTLYACLNEINSSERKIITIEDPVEYEMDGITQVQVNPKVKFNFSTGLRSLLRHDPDIIMVGEVRDLETAEIAIRTALTGHLVFSTLHTNDAASGITRLVDMGVEPYLVASSVESFVAQRLVRVICGRCKVEDTDPMPGIKDEIARSLNLSSSKDVKIFCGTGCDFCNHTGFYGRKAIYEILTLNDSIRAAILEKPRSDYIKKIAIQEGLTTLRQNGWKAVLDGVTTPREVMNVTVKDKFSSEKPSHGQSMAQSSLPLQSKEKGSTDTSQLEELKKKEKILTKDNDKGQKYQRATSSIAIRYQLARRNPDHPKEILVEGAVHSSLTENISAGGLRFKSSLIATVGSLIDLRIQLPGHSESISCLAKVCRLEENNLESLYEIAINYLNISEDHQNIIDQYVKQHLKE